MTIIQRPPLDYYSVILQLKNEEIPNGFCVWMGAAVAHLSERALFTSANVGLSPVGNDL